MPKVSVLMATYNRAKFLDRSIESVRAQSFKDWELIIMDDASTDTTPEVARAWAKKEPRVVYVRGELNLHTTKNYNRGFSHAKGEYIAMLDDDDAWSDPDKLRKQAEFLGEHPDYVAVGGGMIVIDAQGKELYRYLKPHTDRDIRDRMLLTNPIANSTSMFRRATAEKVGWYDATLRWSGDRDFFAKMGLVGKLYNFPEYFSYYTMAGQNASITSMRPHLKVSLQVMNRYHDKYPKYHPALFVNWSQYIYSFFPLWIKKLIHRSLARVKRFLVG